MTTSQLCPIVNVSNSLKTGTAALRSLGVELGIERWSERRLSLSTDLSPSLPFFLDDIGDSVRPLVQVQLHQLADIEYTTQNRKVVVRSCDTKGAYKMLPGQSKSWDRRNVWCVGGMLAFYLVLASVLPVADDEVYYWSWARPLQFSYYDHPPLTAYLIRISTDVFGNSVFGFRVPACLASVFVLATIAHLTRSRVLIPWVACTPLFTLGAVLITPDSPLLMAWAAYLWWLVEVHRRLTPSAEEGATSTALASERGVSQDAAGIPWWMWLAGGVILGAGVLGKYTMALAVPSGFVSFLMVGRLWRRWLVGYIAHGVVSFVVASPILIHNIQHDFVPLLFQWRHSMGHSEPGWKPFGEFVGVQILLFGTLPFFLLPWVVWKFRDLCENPRLRACACLYLVPISFFIYKATRAPLQGNWALVVFVSFWPLAAVWYESVRQSAFWRWSTASSFFVPVASVLVMTAHLIRPLPIIPIEGDRVTRQYAVDKATRQIAKLVHDRGKDFPVYASTYQWTAWLRFQSLEARQIDKLSRPSHFTQHSEQATDADRAFVVAEHPLPAEFTEGFDPPEVVARIPLVVRGETWRELQLFLYTKTAIASSGDTVRR
jgi:Dolichyl-phosphate-mannose-protein mannosyltransferase